MPALNHNSIWDSLALAIASNKFSLTQKPLPVSGFFIRCNSGFMKTQIFSSYSQ